MIYPLEKIKIRINTVFKTNMYANNDTKVQHTKMKDRTVIIIFSIYCTYLLICCAIYSNLWWNGAKCTDN